MLEVCQASNNSKEEEARLEFGVNVLVVSVDFTQSFHESEAAWRFLIESISAFLSLSSTPSFAKSSSPISHQQRLTVP
jgi:hypothetical protein